MEDNAFLKLNKEPNKECIIKKSKIEKNYVQENDSDNSIESSNIINERKKALINLLEEHKKEEINNNYEISEKKVNKIPKKIYGIVGLKNIGLTCYMNASLQILKNIFPLNEYLFESRKYLKSENCLLIIEYSKIILEILSDENDYFSPKDFKNCLDNKISDFKGRKQCDPKNFILLLLQNFHNILSELNLKSLTANDFNYVFANYNIQNEYNNFVAEFINKKNSKIIQLFYGVFHTTFECQNCKFLKNNFTLNFIFDLPVYDYIHKKKLSTIKECYDAFTKINKKQMKCQFCKENAIIKRFLKLIILPQYIILILNRRRVDNSIYDNLIKYDFILDASFFFNNTNFKDTYYELIGIIIHKGKNKSIGHKIAYSKNIFNNKWYSYDDENVNEINEDKVINHNLAHILVYQNSSIRLNRKSYNNFASLIEKNKNSHNTIKSKINKKLINRNNNYTKIIIIIIMILILFFIFLLLKLMKFI